MLFTILRRLVVYLVLTGMAAPVWAGMTQQTTYTERGKTDFDTVLQLLNPFGKWSKISGKWAFTPTDLMVPYTDGRWVYTEYGWYWKGNAPFSWVTEHYGYWKCSADKIWSWYPGPYWLPQIVEIRASTKYVGWRLAEVDDEGNFVEQPIDRYSKPDQWTFVTLAQFANPITPGIVAKPAVAEAQLNDSTACRHTYLTYREIDRPGPHPADFADLCKDGGMLAPRTMQDEAAEQKVLPKLPATNAAGVKMTGVNLPTLVGAPTEVNPAADTRQVKYWVTMSLPTFWTKPPADAKSNEIYIYRPDIFQDQDGIARRIALWFNPKERTTLRDVLANPSSALTAATPVKKQDPFQSPLDDSYHPSAFKHATTNAAPTGGVPPGTNAPPMNPAEIKYP